MKLSSLWSNAVVINVAIALYSGTAFRSPYKLKIDCRPYLNSDDECTREYYPVCATNGKTYCNKCIFCQALKLDTMSSSLLWIKITFILALVVPFYYETTFAFSKEVRRQIVTSTEHSQTSVPENGIQSVGLMDTLTATSVFSATRR
ncbi:serine protease inhibitor Kazal-type 10 isoform X2 [Mus pahari]|uniref:serine protease inhibitor Kazal-type 10 isoform X2 n=1 Tax=Mus pahari TaxID=10093 RepID=UPI000A313783|nr:serine protease inhibitor Kazal-type 10 isoform X2 [Mus pahari]